MNINNYIPSILMDFREFTKFSVGIIVVLYLIATVCKRTLQFIKLDIYNGQGF